MDEKTNPAFQAGSRSGLQPSVPDQLQEQNLSAMEQAAMEAAGFMVEEVIPEDDQECGLDMQIMNALADLATEEPEVGLKFINYARSSRGLVGEESAGETLESAGEALESAGEALEPAGEVLDSAGDALESTGEALESVGVAVGETAEAVADGLGSIFAVFFE